MTTRAGDCVLRGPDLNPKSKLQALGNGHYLVLLDLCRTRLSKSVVRYKADVKSGRNNLICVCGKTVGPNMQASSSKDDGRQSKES